MNKNDAIQNAYNQPKVVEMGSDITSTISAKDTVSRIEVMDPPLTISSLIALWEEYLRDKQVKGWMLFDDKPTFNPTFNDFMDWLKEQE